MLERLARSCYLRRRPVLALWVVALIAMVVLGRAAAGEYSGDFLTPGSESKAAFELLQERFPARAGDTIFVVFKADRGVPDPATRSRVESLLEELRRHPHVVGVISPYSTEGATQVSRSGTIAFATLQLDVQGSEIEVAQGKEMIAEAEEATGEGVQFELSGLAISNAELVQGGSEGLGILVALVILLISFGSVVAAGLPLLTAIMGIGIGLAILELLANVVNVANFSPIVAAMVGIGVGIDYALFIVTRYRVMLGEGADPQRATVGAIGTAGRAVLFAGTTVVISVMGILLMGLPYVEGVAWGSAAAVVVAMLASVTLLPAMLGFAGTSIDRLRLPFLTHRETHHRAGFWFRWSRLMQRRPWPAFAVGTVIIVLLTLPTLGLRLGFPGDESQPESKTSRRSFDLFTEGFGPGFSAPLLLSAELPGPAGTATLQRLESRLREEPGVAAVVPAQLSPASDAAVVTVFPTTGAQAIETERLVNRLRDDVVPQTVAGSGVEVFIGGPNAALIDSSKAISARLPLFIAVVVLLSFILLMAVFRSVLVALKAAIMNLLSIAAAYGVLVAVAQWGWGKQLFGIESTGVIANFVPMMMFAILFGLSMDYEVFLLSRIREEYDKTGDNALAVADGLAATARVITAAAAIMVMVFLAFVLGPELIIKQIGLGLAAAILIDATIIRMILVPSTMELLGKANWWLPRWLDKVLPNIKFEGSEAPVEEARQPVTAGPGDGR